MRAIKLAFCVFSLFCGIADLAPAQTAPEGDLRIGWEVKNRFRLFRNEADFARHVAVHRGGVLAAEQRLAAATNGRGWARDMLDGLCLDQTGKLVEVCQRDGERESYLAPRDHRVTVLLTGTVPAGATCAWNFHDADGAPQQLNTRCDEEINARVHFGRPTIVTVDVTLADQTTRRAVTEILVRDFLIAGLGDSIAAGEGNPDRPIALADSGFCFRRFGGGEEYFRPGRAGYRGDKACDASGASGTNDRDWARHGARWVSAACHRSLYGHQLRTALALAVENPQIAVTFLPLACSGATIETGLFKSQRARECPPAPAPCIRTVPAQLQQLQDALASARRQMPERRLDLVLLTVGANDILFSSLVADVIIEAASERALLKSGGMIASVAEAQRNLDTELPTNFARLRAALKPLVGGDLARVIYVTYGHPALLGGQACPGGRHGFDVHPAFGVDSDRLRPVAEFVSNRFLPRMKALARCEAGVLCREPDSEAMTFVDGHQQEFEARGFCARSSGDPVFDRECFSERGESFETSPVVAATDPMVCAQRPSEFRPYAPRARWIRTANDSYFTAMTFPEGLPPTLQPSDIHDATWGATSAVYGGAIHPTAEGHAAMADAALPAVRQVLGLSPPRQ